MQAPEEPVMNYTCGRCFGPKVEARRFKSVIDSREPPEKVYGVHPFFSVWVGWL